MLMKALLLGLSTGPFCLGSCLSVLFPLICGGGRGPEGASPLAARLRLLGRFSLGRLVAYLGFGALAGWLGGQVQHPLLSRISGAGLILLSLLLIAHGLVANSTFSSPTLSVATPVNTTRLSDSRCAVVITAAGGSICGS